MLERLLRASLGEFGCQNTRHRHHMTPKLEQQQSTTEPSFAWYKESTWTPALLQGAEDAWVRSARWKSSRHGSRVGSGKLVRGRRFHDLMRARPQRSFVPETHILCIPGYWCEQTNTMQAPRYTRLWCGLCALQARTCKSEAKPEGLKYVVSGTTSDDESIAAREPHRAVRRVKRLVKRQAAVKRFKPIAFIEVDWGRR